MGQNGTMPTFTSDHSLHVLFKVILINGQRNQDVRYIRRVIVEATEGNPEDHTGTTLCSIDKDESDTLHDNLCMPPGCFIGPG